MDQDATRKLLILSQKLFGFIGWLHIHLHFICLVVISTIKWDALSSRDVNYCLLSLYIEVLLTTNIHT